MTMQSSGIKISLSEGADEQPYSVTFAGDINGDGLDDFLIQAAPQLLREFEYRSYSFDFNDYVVFGSTDLRPSQITLPNILGRGDGFAIEGGSLSQSEIVGLGDINGDGFGDFGNPANSGQAFLGRAQIGRGVTTNIYELNRDGFVTQPSVGGYQQKQILGRGDINGDGLNDLLGFEQYDNMGNIDVAFGRYGNETPFSGGQQPDLTISGGAIFSFYQQNAQILGDFNGDGFDDILLYSYGYDYSGAVHVVFGAETFDANEVDVSSAGDAEVFTALGRDNATRLYAESFGALGDINGDGFDDIGVVEYFDNFDSNLRVVFGRDGSGTESDDLVLSDLPVPQSGIVFDGIGDFNGDGIDDFAIGLDENLDGEGEVLVIFGGQALQSLDLNGLNASQGLRITGAATGLGVSVSGLGDVNGDGESDLGIGSRSGDTYVVFGGATFISQLDGAGGSVDGLLNLEDIGIGPEVSPPEAVTDIFNLNTGFFTQSFSYDILLGNDISPDGRELRIVGFDGSVLSFGQFTQDDNFQRVLFGASTPEALALRAGDMVTDTLLYTITDGLVTATGEIEFVITGRSDAPILVSDVAIREGSGEIIIDALANDLDPEGGILEVVALGDPIGGSVALNATGDIVYSPNAGFEGKDRFTYTVRDDTGLETEGVIEVLPRGQFAGLTIEGSEHRGSLGEDIAVVGDFNGDGVEDFVVGLPGATFSGDDQSGGAAVIFGNNAGFPERLELSDLGDAGVIFDLSDEQLRAGARVDAIGDVNGDGLDDLLIGTTFILGSGQTLETSGTIGGDGTAFIIFGSTTAQNLDLDALTPEQGVRLDLGFDDILALTTSAGRLGDIDGDGFDDLALSAFGTNVNFSLGIDGRLSAFSRAGESKVFVLFGGDSIDGDVVDIAPEISFSGFSNRFTGIESLGDVNGDGQRDLLLTAQGFSSEPSFVLYGAENPGREGFDISELPEDRGFFLSATGMDTAGNAGDLNGDGIDDIAIANEFARDANGTFYSSVHIIYGSAVQERGIVRTDDLTPAEGFLIEGIQRAGVSVDGVGDVNGDGIEDLLIGAPRGDSDDPANSPVVEGKAFLIFGTQTLRDSPLDVTALTPDQGLVFEGTGATDRFGYAVAGAGDLDGDGINDLFVTAPSADSADPDLFNAGAAYVIFGSTQFDVLDGLDGQSDGTISLFLLDADRPDADTELPEVITVASNGDVSEGNSGTTTVRFTVSRLTESLEGTLTVNASFEGGTAQSSDVVGSLPRDVTVIFAPGEITQTLTVDVNGDRDEEFNETLRLALNNASATSGADVNFIASSAIATILNDDQNAELSIQDAGNVVEGDMGVQDMEFVVTRAGGLEADVSATVRFEGFDGAVSDDVVGGLFQDVDINFAAGQTEAIVSIGIIGDRIIETDETIRATLLNVAASFAEVEILDGTANGTILTDDEATIINVAPVEAEIFEGVTSTFNDFAGNPPVRVFGRPGVDFTAEDDLSFIVTRSGDLDTTVAVDYTVYEGETFARPVKFVTYESESTRFNLFSNDFERRFLNTFEVDTATTLQEQLPGFANPFNRLESLGTTFGLKDALSVNDLAGIGLTAPINKTLLEFSADDLGLSNVPILSTGGLVKGRFEADIEGKLNLGLTGVSLGAFDTDSTLTGNISLPNFALSGEEFNIGLDSNFGLNHAFTTDQLDLGTFNLTLELEGSDFGLRDLGLGFGPFTFIDGPDINFPEFDFPITLLEGKAFNEFDQEIIDGLNLRFSPPEGNENTSFARGLGLATATALNQDQLISLNFSLLELASNIPQLGVLDFLKEDENFKFQFGSVEYNLEIDYTLFDLFTSIGLGLVQSFAFTPTLSAVVEVGGQVLEGAFGDVFNFTAPDSVGPLEGSAKFQYGGSLSVSYGLQPVATAGVKVGEFGVSLTDDQSSNVFSTGIGPLFEKSIEAGFGPRIDLFTINNLELPEDAFAPYTFNFDVPVRNSEISEDALITGTVLFAPGETEKVVTLNVLRDITPEADQSIRFEIDDAFALEGALVIVETDEAEVLVRDDDDISASFSFGRLFRRDADAGGDPHLVTLDGLGYDFHGVGEFTLVETTSGPEFHLQARMAAVPGSEIASQITALAMQFGDVVITMEATGTDVVVSIDGETVEIALSPGVIEAGDGLIYFDGDAYTFENANGDMVKAGGNGAFLNACFFPAETREDGTFRGLLGDGDRDPTNDLQLQDGTALTQPVSFGDLYGVFANAWRVSDGPEGNSLFTYPDGLGTDDFTDYNFPVTALTLDDLPADVLAAAITAVDAAGVTDPTLREFAIYDFAVTGDEAFLNIEEVFFARPQARTEPVDTPPPPSLIGIAALTPFVKEGDAGTDALVYQVYRTGDLSEAVTLDVALTGGTLSASVAGQIPASVTLEVGQESQNITVELPADTVPDEDILITLGLSNIPEASLILSDSATIRRIDNDRAPEPDISINRISEEETLEDAGNAIVFEVRLSEPASSQVDAVVALASAIGFDPISAEDFIEETQMLQNISFAPGESVVQISLNISPDMVLEANEAVVARLVRSDGAQITQSDAVAVILNDDTNSAPQAAEIDLGLILESDGDLAIDLLSGVTDPDGDALTIENVVVTLTGDVSGDVVLDPNVALPMLRLDPRQFADALEVGQSVTVQIVYDIIDPHGAQVSGSATVVIDGLTGPFQFFRDVDGDGFGNPDDVVPGYILEDGFATVGGDLNDENPTVFPNAPEINDSLDNDQDGSIDEDNQAPAANADSLTVDEGALFTGDLLANDTDVEGDDLEIASANGASPGTFFTVTSAGGRTAMAITAATAGLGEFTVAVDQTGMFADLAEGETDTISFGYTISDGNGGTDTATFTLTIEGVNEAPVAVASSATGDEDTVISGTLIASDVDGDTLAFEVVDGPSNGSVTIGPNGAFQFTPVADFNGTDSFTFRASDGALSDTATATITVSPVDEPVGPVDPVDPVDTIDPVGPVNPVAPVNPIAPPGPVGPTAGDDTLLGTALNDTINALAGNDDVSGLAGDDLLIGGGGNDSLKGAAGDDRLRGNDGDDTLKGGGGDDNLKGNGGADVIRGNGGDDVIRAGGGENNVKGGDGSDLIFGGGGADELNGGGGADTLRGRAGDDTLNGGSGRDVLVGGRHDDLLLGRAGRDTVNGGSGHDDLFGGRGRDDIKGGGGDDVINAGRGDDTIKGNGGNDTFQFRRGDGSDIINGFQQSRDLIEIISGIVDFENLDISQDGRNVLIEFANVDITVINARVDQFDEDDFIF